ncbi:MAG: NifU family protein [Candidatus Hydrogenedentes bacterium]|nr:NifU family protein [Candidatus Hydrogenedentota bacterium]
MPNWFSKVFSGGAAKVQPAPPAPAPRPAPRPMPQPDPNARRVVNAPLLADTNPDLTPSADIRIKARVEQGKGACTFMADRPILAGHSAWFPGKRAAAESPLAMALFEIKGVETVLLHDYTITVQRTPTIHADWTEMAREIGACIREHLIEERPVVTEAFLAKLPGEDAIRDRIQRVLDAEINPGIAAHSGAIRLDRVEGNTVYIEMLGGCQGCAASDVTLRQGVHEAFRSAVPEVGAILDVTDHASGQNPFYAQLPAGMA